jgi:hypothetical protein
MSSGIQLRADAQRSLAFGSIGASYAAIGSAFGFPMRIIKVDNLTDATLQFSFTGNTDHFVLPAGGFLLVDVCTNEVQTQGFFISTGTTIYVKRSGTPTSGSVYVTTFYGV